MLNIGLIALGSGGLAQVVKMVLGSLRGRRLRWALLFANGGMPSSHTAVVVALSCLVGQREGVASPLFSLTAIFSLYVIFEATGLRQEVGKQAELLNELIDELAAGRRPDQRRLKELLGHTWQEVAGGLLFGLIAAEVVWRWRTG